MQLFITPSNNILMTGITLGSTMLCLIIVIGVLQYQERVNIKIFTFSRLINKIVIIFPFLTRKWMIKSVNSNHSVFILMAYKKKQNITNSDFILKSMNFITQRFIVVKMKSPVIQKTKKYFSSNLFTF
jgi:hypothetical protein